MDLQRHPPRDRCCSNCKPTLLSPFLPTSSRDKRLSAFAGDFVFPLAQPQSRPASSASIRSNTSRASHFEPNTGSFKVPEVKKQDLCARLEKWRDEKHLREGASRYISRHVSAPPTLLTKLLSNCERFFRCTQVTARQLRKAMQ